MGQVCTATSRLYIQDTIYDKFLEAFKKQTKENTKIGSQFDADTNHGPQISKAAQEKILSYIDTAEPDGAQLIHGGKQDGIPEKGYFIEPAVFANCNNDMKIVREEIFGPFVVIQSFKTEDEAVEKANDTEFGLGAAVFTKDIMRGHRVAGAIEAGMVWVRFWTRFFATRQVLMTIQINSSQDSHFGVPFGGYKQSGIGRELGAYALSSYTQVKAVHVNLGTFL
jgi:aldehyde dehydrogenase (NAD+)